VDGDGPLDLAWRAADIDAGCIHDLAQGSHAGGSIAGVGVPGVPQIHVRRRDPEHPRTVRADHQRRSVRPWPVRQQLAVAGAEVGSLEVDRAVPQQAADDREGFLEAVDPVVERHAERAELGLVPAGPDAEHEPATRDLVDRVGLLGQDRRVVEAEAGDERPELDPARHGRDRGKARPGLPRPSRRPVTPSVEQMLAEPDRVVAQVLDRADHVEDLGPAHLALDLRQLDTDLERPRHGNLPFRAERDSPLRGLSQLPTQFRPWRAWPHARLAT
jgi:hypothetical protein